MRHLRKAVRTEMRPDHCLVLEKSWCLSALPLNLAEHRLPMFRLLKDQTEVWVAVWRFVYPKQVSPFAAVPPTSCFCSGGFQHHPIAVYSVSLMLAADLPALSAALVYFPKASGFALPGVFLCSSFLVPGHGG